MSGRISSIEAALRNLGGQARTPEIAAEIRRSFPGPHPRTLLDSIRGRLQECSSDSKHFRGKEDLFYRVNGIRGGVWGLRANRDSAAEEAEEPKLEEFIARLEGGAQPNLGDERELKARGQVTADARRLKHTAARVQPAHGGIGHNRPPMELGREPPEADLVLSVAKDAATIEEEIQKEKPDALVLARRARRLQRLTQWLSGKADIFAEEFAKSFGKSLGKYGAAAIAASSLILATGSLIRSVAHWLQLVVQ